MPLRTDAKAPTDKVRRQEEREDDDPPVDEAEVEKAKEAWQAPAQQRPRRAKGPVALDGDAGAPSSDQVKRAQAALASGTLRGPDAAPAMRVLEAALRDPSATVLSRVKLGGGVNGTFIVTLSNGVKAVWKPSAKEAMVSFRWQLERDHQARREAAAYAVDKALGHLAGVPPTVMRELEDGPGALMAFVPDTATAKEAKLRLKRDDEYDALALFDNVIGNTDRHTGNLLVTEDGHKIPIDHGLAFPLGNERKGWKWLPLGNQGVHNFIFKKTVQLGERQLALLKGFVARRAEISAELTGLGIDPKAVTAMYARVDAMIAAQQTVGTWR